MAEVKCLVCGKVIKNLPDWVKDVIEKGSVDGLACYGCEESA